MMALTVVLLMGFGILAFGILLYIDKAEGDFDGEYRNGSHRRTDGEDDGD